MWELETNFLLTYTEQIGLAFDAFLPVWAATIGTFLAFAIANMIRFFVSRMVKQ